MIIGRAGNENLPVLSAHWPFSILLARSIIIKLKLECRLNMGILGAYCALLGVALAHKVTFWTCVDNGTINCHVRYIFIRFVECTSKSIKQYKNLLLRSRTSSLHLRAAKTQAEQANAGHLARRKSKLSAGSPKSTHHLKSHKDHRSWTRALQAFSHLSRGLHTYIFRQFRTDLTQYCLRAKIQKMGVVSAIRKGRSSHIHHFPGLFTKRIGNIVVFPALCKPRWSEISQIVLNLP